MEELFYKVCRTCLGQEGDFHSLFVTSQNTGVPLSFADMIMTYTSIKVAVGDGLPEQICTTCATAVLHFYLFKLRLEESDVVLRQQLDKSQVQALSENICYASEDSQASIESKKYSGTPSPVDTVKTDTTEDLVCCDICLKTFNGITNLDQHMQRYHDDDAIVDVKENLERLDELIPKTLIAVKADEIVKLSSPKINLKCPECNKKLKNVRYLKRHLKIHTSTKHHFCDVCNKGFVRTEQYHSHMNGHSGVKPHVCAICNKGFNQLSNLKDHMRTHNGEKPFLCSICGKGFNQLGNLRQHTVRHTGVKSHVCSTCGHGFASKGELCAHLRKHTGARPFICPVCSHGFTTSSSLTKHKRIHSGEKPYECEVCKMKFSRSGILARHKRTHTGEKPYVCKYCSKAFSQSNDLSSHLRIHTGEKPYICDVCGQAFRQSSALKTHKKTHADRTSVIEIEPSHHNFVPVIQHNSFLKNELHYPYEL